MGTVTVVSDQASATEMNASSVTLMFLENYAKSMQNNMQNNNKIILKYYKYQNFLVGLNFFTCEIKAFLSDFPQDFSKFLRCPEFELSLL